MSQVSELGNNSSSELMNETTAKPVPAIVRMDRFALGGLALGIGLCVFPFPEGTLKFGFWITLLFTVFHIYTSHAAPAASR